MRKILAIIILTGLFGCVEEKKIDYNDSVKDFHPVVISAFDEADKLMIDKTEEVTDGQDPDPAKCICKGTGKITQGDGHVTDCRYHGKQGETNTLEIEDLKSQLNKKNEQISELQKQLEDLNNKISELKSLLSEVNQLEKKAADEVSIKKPDIKILYFTAAWCGPCRQQKAELDKMKAMGYDIGTTETSQIRILDVEKDVELYNKYRGATGSIPLQVILKDGEVHSRIIGFTYKEKIIGQLTGND